MMPRCSPRYLRSVGLGNKKIKKARIWLGGQNLWISITSGARCTFFIASDAKTSFCNDIAPISVDSSNYVTQCPQVSMGMSPQVPLEVREQGLAAMDRQQRQLRLNEWPKIA